MVLADNLASLERLNSFSPENFNPDLDFLFCVTIDGIVLFTSFV
jgi:thymidylate kinase